MEKARQRALEFLAQHKLGVISTIHTDRNTPESAVVGFANTEDFQFIFGTSNLSRKYGNLLANPNLSFVVGWSSTEGTIQYEGTARELAAEEADKYIQILSEKNEASKKFINLPDQRYFLVSPTWLRFSDNAADSPEVHEFQFKE